MRKTIDVKRVARLMAEMGLVARRKPKFRKTTDSKHNLPVAANRLQRTLARSSAPHIS